MLEKTLVTIKNRTPIDTIHRTKTNRDKQSKQSKQR